MLRVGAEGRARGVTAVDALTLAAGGVRLKAEGRCLEMDPTIVDIPEVEKAHRDVWLAFEVLEVDKRRHAKRGRLIAADRSRK